MYWHLSESYEHYTVSRLIVLTIFIFEAEKVGERTCLLAFQVSPSSNINPRGAFSVTLDTEFYI